MFGKKMKTWKKFSKAVVTNFVDGSRRVFGSESERVNNLYFSHFLLLLLARKGKFHFSLNKFKF